MSYTLAPIALTGNVTSYVTLPGNGQSVAYIKLTNASPYLVLLTNLTSGQDYLEPGECNLWPVDGLTTSIQATPLVFLNSPTVIPVSVLVATWFLVGETPSGTYPVNFNVLNYQGNSVASTLVNDGSAAGTLIIETRPENKSNAYFALYNDGTATWQVLLTNGATLTVVEVVSDTTTKLTQLIFPQGWGSGTNPGVSGCVDDGAGNLTAHSLAVASPPTLIAGNQLTDGCARIFTAAGANEGDGYYVPFKCHLTNVPTSITLTVSSSSNVKAGTPTATNITRDGFLFFVEANAAGVTSWQGTYTTVGN